MFFEDTSSLAEVLIVWLHKLNPNLEHIDRMMVQKPVATYMVWVIDLLSSIVVGSAHQHLWHCCWQRQYRYFLESVNFRCILYCSQKVLHMSCAERNRIVRKCFPQSQPYYASSLFRSLTSALLHKIMSNGAMKLTYAILS